MPPGILTDDAENCGIGAVGWIRMMPQNTRSHSPSERLSRGVDMNTRLYSLTSGEQKTNQKASSHIYVQKHFTPRVRAASSCPSNMTVLAEQ